MIRRLALVAALMCAGCSDLGTDPNAVVAIRFEGSSYPSIVLGDSLRDSTGALQPLRATGLNYKGEPIANAQFLFSSPDTALRILDNGNVFARTMTTGGSPARVFATVGSLQSQSDSLLVVARADSIKPVKAQDTIRVSSTSAEGTTGQNTVQFTLFGDTLAGAPKVVVPGWLVSFRLRYRGSVVPISDTARAYTYIITGSGTNAHPVPSLVDTTDGSGVAGRGVLLRPLSTPGSEDTIFVVATATRRKTGTTPLTAETMMIILR